MKEKMIRTTTEDLRSTATMLTMIKILKTMNNTIIYQNLPSKKLMIAIDTLMQGKSAVHGKKVMITVTYKKGDPTKPDSYRPICSLPMFCTLSSTTLYNRPYAKLDGYPFSDQAGFRKIPDDGSSHDVQTYCPEKQIIGN